MDIKERAKDYAEGKATAAIEQAIADAYADGYKDGYQDRDDEIPVEIKENEKQWIDLGLPSGTLWSIVVDEKGKAILSTHLNAEMEYNLPDYRQIIELCDFCTVEYNAVAFVLRGPNGRTIKMPRESVELSTTKMFWEKSDEFSEKKPTRRCFGYAKGEFVLNYEKASKLLAIAQVKTK